MSISGPPAPFWPLSAPRSCRRSLTLSDSHGSSIELVILVITIVAIVVAAHALLELRGLPVRAVAFALAEELEVAVEALEAGCAQCRRHLALQSDLGIVMRAAHGFGDRERDRPVVGVLSAAVGPEQGDRGKEHRADLQ